MKTLLKKTQNTTTYLYNGAIVTVYNSRKRYNRYAYIVYLGETAAVKGGFSTTLWCKIDRVMYYAELRMLYEIANTVREINRNARRHKTVSN